VGKLDLRVVGKRRRAAERGWVGSGIGHNFSLIAQDLLTSRQLTFANPRTAPTGPDGCGKCRIRSFTSSHCFPSRGSAR
jgi:hypothetical protein